MRPPAKRNFVGVAQQLRPTFGTPSGPTPAPVRAHHAAENGDSMLIQACQRAYQQDAMPLLPVNRHRSQDPAGDYSRHPPRPMLPRRPSVRVPPLARRRPVHGPDARAAWRREPSESGFWRESSICVT